MMTEYDGKIVERNLRLPAQKCLVCSDSKGLTPQQQLESY